MMKRLLFSLLLLFLVGVTFITYSNHFHNSFHFDDNHTIENNLYIRSLDNIPRFFTDATTMSTLPSNQSYRPLLTTSTAIDFYLSKAATPDPFVFHVTSFLLFVVLGIIVCYLLLHFLNKSLDSSLNPYVALFGMGWFLLHAANAETVNYIIARSDIMSTLFIAAGLACYIYFEGLRKYHLYIIPVLLGLLSKELAIIFIPILVLYKLFFEHHLPIDKWWVERRKLWAVLVSSVVPIIIILICFLFVRKMTSFTWTPGGNSTMKYIFTQPFVVFHYWYNFLLPVNLVVDTDWDVIRTYTDGRVFAGLLFIVALLIAAVISSRKATTRPIAFGIGWFLVALAPTSLLPFAEVLNDHRTFFPYIGLFIVAATLIRNGLYHYRFLQGSYVRWGMGLCALLFLGLHAHATYNRNKVWATEEVLWKETTEKAPGNGRGWMNYGVALMARGDFANAEACFLKTTQLWPNYSRVYTNLGVVKQQQGSPAEAEQYFKKSLRLGPGVPVAYSLYGNFLSSQGRFDEADSVIAIGLQISPNLENLLRARADNQKRQKEGYGARDSAVSVKNSGNDAEVQAKAVTPEDLITLSVSYYNSGNYEKCIAAAEEALKLRPGYDIAYNNICVSYNMLKQYDKAIKAGETGLKFNASNQFLKGNLAEAYRQKK